MSQFDEIIVAMQNESYSTKRQLLEYLLRMLQSMKNGKNGLKPEDKTALLEYAYGEVEVFLGAIADAASYKEKDLIFGCEDLLLGLIMISLRLTKQVRKIIGAHLLIITISLFQNLIRLI